MAPQQSGSGGLWALRAFVDRGLSVGEKAQVDLVLSRYVRSSVTYVDDVLITHTIRAIISSNSSRRTLVLIFFKLHSNAPPNLHTPVNADACGAPAMY